MKEFLNYADFCNWVYYIKDDETQTYPRLNEKFKFKVDNIIYESVMDCLHAHEEG